MQGMICIQLYCIVNEILYRHMDWEYARMTCIKWDALNEIQSEINKMSCIQRGAYDKMERIEWMVYKTKCMIA